MERHKDFDKFYEESISSKLDDLNEKQQAIAKVGTKAGLGVGMIFFAWFFGQFLSMVATMHSRSGGMFVGLIFGGIFILGLYLAISHGVPFFKYRKELKNSFKKEIIEEIVKFVDPNLNYSPEKGIPNEEIDNSGIMPSYDRFYTEDAIYGNIDSVPVFFAEVRTTETHGSGKNRHTVTTFHGMFIEIRYPKQFHGKIKVLPKVSSFMKALFNYFSDEEKIELEDPEFNKKFNTFATDQVEARYIVTPTIIEQIKTLKNTEQCDVRIAFVDGKMLIALDYREPLLEPRMLNYEKIYSYYLTIAVVQNIIRGFKIADTQINKNRTTQTNTQ